MPLPPGLILNPQTGELAGIPTVAGTYVIDLTVRDALGNKREISDSVTINAYTPMAWSGTFPFLMATRVMGNDNIEVAGGLAPLGYVIQSGALPDGLTIDPVTGFISGTPTTPGPFNFVVRATDALAQTADILVIGSVIENLTLEYGATALGTVGVAMSTTPVPAGGTIPYTYSLVSGALPAGLSLAPATGIVSGTPTATNADTITLRITDAMGFTTDDTKTYDIRDKPVVSGSLIRWMRNKPGYSRTFSGTNGHTPYSFAATGLPTGLTINSASGEVSGTPTVAGTFESARITLTDNLGNITQTPLISVEIAAILTISGSYATSATRNIAYPTFSPAVAGGFSPRTYSISAGALPAGLTLDPSNGAISGTPTAQGSFTATLRVTDADGNFAEMAFNLDVSGDMAMTGGVPARGTTTVAFTGDTLGVTGGTSPYTWSVQSGALPNGVTLNTATGDLSGTPTVAGTFNFTIRVTDAAGGWVQNAFSTVVAAFPTLTGNLPDDTRTTTYSASLSRAGGHAPYAFDLSAGTLPTGLSINATTGAITGTATVSATSNFTVRVTDDAGNVATSAQSITIYDPVAFTGGYTLDGEVSDPYSSNGLGTTGGKAPISWSLAGGTLPPGTTLNAGTGAITGTPTTAGTYSFTIRASDALGFAPTLDQEIQILARVGITGDYVANAEAGVAYSDDLNPTGGKATYTWTHVAGTLPPGLTLGSGTGTLSGTPTTPGNYSFTIRVTDGFGVIADRAESIAVVAAVDISGAAQDGTVGVGFSTFTPVRTGGLAPFSYAIVSGAIPTGLAFSTSTGAISGTPTGAGTFNYTIRVTSALGGTDDLADSVQINAFPTLTLNYSRGMVGKVYSDTVTAGSGWTPYSFSVVSGAIPTGLTLNASTGAITGTPSAAGTYNFTIRLTDAKGNIVNRAGSIAIAAAMALPTTYATPVKEDLAYSSTVVATGGWSPYSYATIAGAIPTGTTLGASTGTISGTPTTPGTYNFTIRATDADGSTKDKAFSIVIQTAAIALSASASPNPARDTAFSNGLDVTATAFSTVTATGGSGVYTSYAWAKVGDGGQGADFTTSLSNGNRTRTCSHTGRFNFEEWEIWRCTVTDSLGAQDSVDITFELIIHDNR